MKWNIRNIVNTKLNYSLIQVGKSLNAERKVRETGREEMADTPDSTLALYLFTKLKLRLSIIGSWGEMKLNYTR